MADLTVLQYIIFVFILIITGLFAGFSGSFFGVGGGTVLIPVLLAVFNYIQPNSPSHMHEAVGVSLALIIFNTVTAALRHHKEGYLDLTFFRSWAVWTLVGSIIGGIILAFVSSLFIKILFAVYLFAAAIFELFKKEKVHKKSHTDCQPKGFVKRIGAIIIAALALILGLAGGTFTTPFLMYFDYPIKRAMAISVAGGIIIGTIGTIAAIIVGWGMPNRLPWSLGYVNIITVLIIAPFIIISSPWGVKVSNRVPNHMLRWYYIIFLFVLAIYMTLELFRVT